MNKMFLTMLGTGLLWFASEANALSERQQIGNLLTDILHAKERIDEQPVDAVPEEIADSWQAALHPTDSKTGILGVVSLWGKKRLSLVELIWWRQKSPDVRKCILLLYYGLTKVETDNFPDFAAYAARFSRGEAEARKGEIEEVKRIVAASRPALKQALGDK